MPKTFYDYALERVNGSDALRPYAAIILGRPQGDNSHWRWVNAATEEALVDWARGVERGKS